MGKTKKANKHVKENVAKLQTNENHEEQPKAELSNNDRKSDETGYHPKFSKRKIVSNWDRYDQYHEEDSTDHIGQVKPKSYIDILENKGGLSSHFQFKEEKSWLDSFNSNVEDGFLQLNVQLLASDISSFSIMEKLQIFDDMDEACKYCFDEMEFEKPYKEESSSKDIRTDSPSENISTADVQSFRIDNEEEVISNDIDTDLSRNQTLTDPTRQESSDGDKETECITIKTTDDDDDLDELLETTLEVNVTTSSKSSHNDTKTEASELDDWLDDLLS